jgi:hypothetical protein
LRYFLGVSPRCIGGRAIAASPPSPKATVCGLSATIPHASQSVRMLPAYYDLLIMVIIPLENHYCI